MDITLPLNANVQMAINKATDSGPNLKLNQVLEAKVIDTQIMLDTLALKIDGKSVNVQTKLPITLQPGQTLQLQVTKLLPTPELKILAALIQPGDSALRSAIEGQTIKLLNLPAPTNPPANSLLNQLSTGQPLQATIIEIAGDKVTLQFQTATTTPNTQTAATTALNQPANNLQTTPNPEKLLLTLDIKQLLVTSDKPTASQPTLTALKAGSEINLQLIKPGNPPTFNVTPVSLDSNQQIIEAFKQLLPIQTSSAPLLNQLRQVLPQLQNAATVAETLKSLAQEILRTIPGKTQLAEPTQLKQAISESGLFLESKLVELLSGKPDVLLQDDFKLKLSKLIQLINQELSKQNDNKLTIDTLKESLQKAQAALAKLTLDQLNSLPREESPKQSWSLELPFFHNQTTDNVKIEIEQDKARDTDNPQTNWAVSITITPPDLATIHCKISCYDGSINTRFWSEAAGTVDKINAHLDYLKQQFENKGLTTGFMEAHQGQPAQSDSSKKSINNLLHEKA